MMKYSVMVITGGTRVWIQMRAKRFTSLAQMLCKATQYKRVMLSLHCR
ncbi:Uncharacterised protein [Acinetobacter baumannii]|nr:Uncharacterised protein [Acinetobacter baumannii]